MRFLGGLLCAIAVISAALTFLDMHLLYLHWLDHWGVKTGWILRIALFILGIILYISGRPIYKG